MIDQATQLLTVLIVKKQLTESEWTLKESISSYLELHFRAATDLLERQLREKDLGDYYEPEKARA